MLYMPMEEVSNVKQAQKGPRLKCRGLSKELFAMQLEAPAFVLKGVVAEVAIVDATTIRAHPR